MIAEPIIIWGAGAMGGSVGAWFHRAGREVLLVDSDDEHVRAINTSGLRITGPVDEFVAHTPALLPAQLSAPLNTVLLCVKAHHTREALLELAPLLAPDGFVVSVQNGLNERWIASAVGTERTVGCFVNFGADVVEPGVVMRGNRGAVVVGELDGAETVRIREIHELFQLFEPNAILTDNINGYLWGKLAYGSMLFATALPDASIADVFASEMHRPALIELARETLSVAAAHGIEPEGFDGIDPSAFAAGASHDSALESLDALVAFNRRSAKTHSGVWRDLAIRKRRTEVDAQVGMVAEMAAEVGIATPLTGRLVELIHDVEEGRRVQSWETLGVLTAQVPSPIREHSTGELAVMRADLADLESTARERRIIAWISTMFMMPFGAVPLFLGLTWYTLLPAMLWVMYTLSTWYQFEETNRRIREVEGQIAAAKVPPHAPNPHND